MMLPFFAREVASSLALLSSLAHQFQPKRWQSLALIIQSSLLAITLITLIFYAASKSSSSRAWGSSGETAATAVAAPSDRPA
jgi:hypothetical protein